MLQGHITCLSSRTLFMLIDQQFFLVISLILVFSLVRQLNFSNFTFTFILKVFNNFSLVDQNT